MKILHVHKLLHFKMVIWGLCFSIMPVNFHANNKSLQKLPKNFTRKYGNGMSNPVSLKPPDGTEWKIYWINHDDEIWFGKGWKEFATYYSLNHGHLLFFEYEETSCFDVNIFDNSALEIDYPFHSTNDEKVEVVQIGDESVEILDDEKIRLEFTLSSPQPCKKIKNCIITNVERDSNELNLHQPAQTRSTRSQKAMPELDEEESKDVSNTEFPKVKQLTSTALTKATTFRSEHPSFMVTMNPAYIYGDYLDIPPHFSKQYLKKTCAAVNLEVLDGRSWTVICSASRITWGWKKFASENNLNVGDACVFELIQKIQGPAFKVSILPAAGEPSCPISQGGSSSQSCSRLESHLKPKILTAIEEASRFTSENPFFIVTLTLDRARKEKLVRYPAFSLLVGSHLQEKISCNLKMFVSLSSSTDKM
ncbi:hypothetical protein Fmac_001663 [Flemingia macrophylla]|uniref:TF-B3 domain-containing protein n=1 Tax=Flemingia macrophylla TaxID=520843 RepID=A0ABD1NIJ4_9FABA